MKKTAQADFSEGPSQHRRQHTIFTRDVLTPPGASSVVARHRAKIILTPFEARRAILEDAASKPEAVRIRSLRRRLTALDRMLTDEEASALERLTTCINSLSNIRSINYLKPEVRYTPLGRVPFSEERRREIGAMSYVLKNLSPAHRAACPNWRCCSIRHTAVQKNRPPKFSRRSAWRHPKWCASTPNGIATKGRRACNEAPSPSSRPLSRPASPARESFLGVDLTQPGRDGLGFQHLLI